MGNLLDFKGSQGDWSKEIVDNNSEKILLLDDMTTITLTRENYSAKHRLVITKEQLEANANLIKQAPKMIQTLVKSYINLQRLSNKSVMVALETNEVRAELRNTISYALGLDGKDVQEFVEEQSYAKEN